MDFFAQQDNARRNALLLSLIFIPTVLVLILLSNLLVTALFFFFKDYSLISGYQKGVDGFLSVLSWSRFGFIGLGITATVGLVVMLKWMQLSSGGSAIAEGMGATRVMPQSLDPAEQRCLNVVDEIALAANMPVPPLYVMRDERGINAFAAGMTPADAVVAITRGAIDHLHRHELQGVIAHEFSHILNGDMRLSMRLAALLKGITFIADVGHLLTHTKRSSLAGQSGRGRNNAAILLLGLSLLALGWLGSIAAQCIKAAISRQKEYLADASAVQFTRSANGIGDALKVIGGYVPGTLVHSARAEEMSHLFFGPVKHRLWQPFATHPPLPQRIARIDSDWDGRYIVRKPQHYPQQPDRHGSGEAGVGRAAIVMAATGAALVNETMPVTSTHSDKDVCDVTQLDQATARQQRIPVALVQHSHEPLGAHALIYSLLISRQETHQRLQLQIIANSGINGLALLATELLPAVTALEAPHRLPLLELCLPALKSISTAQYRVFKTTLLQLIRADQRTELDEWCLFQLLRHYLDPEFIQVKPSRARHRKLAKVKHEICIVIAVLAGTRQGDAKANFRRCMHTLGFSALHMPRPEQSDIAAFSRAVHILADCYPLLKPRLLKAMILAITQKDTLDPVGYEIIASIAAIMDCPIPTVSLRSCA